jgi:hypothetical protein
MTPHQCREARNSLRWSRHELAEAANVPLWFIALFEDKGDPDELYVEWEVRALYALREAGAQFPIENVRDEAGRLPSAPFAQAGMIPRK